MSLARDFPDLPPLWMIGHGVAAAAVARVLPIWTFAGTTARVLGVALAAAGLVLACWAALWFLRKRTTIEPREVPQTLIVEGPFRINRNPIYTGMAAMLLGFALWLGALSALLVAALFPFVIDRRFVVGEEAALQARFGEEARRYIGGTRRW